tara:strand:+ start:1732 stop:3642 length:1911 start_codon:yes stop_codon:yes gene_type:complete
VDYKEKNLIIGDKVINDSKIFVIAEIGVNHNGNLKKAFKLIDHAKNIGADCVKFQYRCLKETYSKEALKITSADLGTQYTLNLLSKFNLSFSDMKRIKAYCTKRNIMFLCTAWDKKSADQLSQLNIPAYKVASADLTNHDLIEHLCKKSKPLIISTGMSTQEDIDDTVKLINKFRKVDYCLLHCNSTYPAPFKDINLSYIKKLLKYGKLVGYSGHERGIGVTLASIGFGARIIERHITLDKNMEGPDHAASLDIQEFKSLIIGIRQVEKSIGSSLDRKLSQGELINRENLSKSIYLKKNIKKGMFFKKSHFEFKSPGQGLQPNHIKRVIGKKAIIDIKKGEALFESHFTRIVKPSKDYNFKHNWGIPVRYHDINSLLGISKPAFVEFHMSYKDMLDNPAKFLNETYNCKFLVHAPELFENDHLLDLCTNNKSYRNKSIKYMKKLINLTIKLNKYFPQTSKPAIITNCGGFSRDDFIPTVKRQQLYNNLVDSLKEIYNPKIEILPQTMAPFPWHFGGQRYQNLFMDVNEIKKFCKIMKMKICNDISHSYLACNTFGWDYYNYIKKLLPHTAHYHISDGSDHSGEGLQIGKGTIDFNKVCKIIKSHNKQVTFIPEIWQGHTNNGAGFWQSLKILDGKI